MARISTAWGKWWASGHDLLGEVEIKGMRFHLTRRKIANRLLFLRGAAEEGGQEIVEAALVLPLLLMLLVGIFWIGRAYNIYETITRAAREGARYAAAPYCSLCPNGNTLPTASSVEAVVDASLSASSLDPTNKTGYTFQQGVALNSDTNTETGVVVSFGYPVKLVIPFTSLNATTITINTQVQMRQENQ